MMSSLEKLIDGCRLRKHEPDRLWSTDVYGWLTSLF
jgi:hypothetical protein